MSADNSRIFFPMPVRKGEYPRKGDGAHYGYAYYRTHIAIDCHRRCVYCDSTEDEAGGAEAMQIDHFRPESFPEFEHLINDPLNLHYSCGRCNLWKSNNWPARGTPHTHNGTDGFVDPFSEDRLNYFEIKSDGQIEPLQPPAKYIIGLLNLKREYLRKLREKRLLLAEFKRRREVYKIELQAALDAGHPADPLKAMEILSAWERIEALLG